MRLPIRPLGTIAEISTGGTPDRRKEKYWGGSIPWVTTGDIDYKIIHEPSEYITEKGLKESAAKLLPAGTIVMAMYGQGATRGKVAKLGIEAATNQACAAIYPKRESINADYLYSVLVHKYEKIRTLGHGGNQQNLNTSLIREIEIPLPPMNEQETIALIARQWDTAIEKTEKLIEAKEQALLYFREQLISKTKQSKRTKLHAVTRESMKRNGNRLGRDSIMAVTKTAGMVPMKEETIAASTERYKVVSPRAFAYNPMRLNIGSIAMSPFDSDVLVSPDYVVFECDESMLAPAYLNQLRYSFHWKNYFDKAGSGSVRVRIYYDDLSAFAIDLPPIDVQRRITGILDASACEIDLLRKQANAFRKQKRGLLQKLLTGEWRVKAAKEGS